MENQFSRTELLLGEKAIEKLHHARVAVFGLGGVGGYTVEALARSGIGTLDLIDNDKICLSNLNRQIFALQNTIGKYKVDVAEERIHLINPDARVNKYQVFYMPETAEQFHFSDYDYVVDAIDTVTGKLALAEQAEQAGTPIISCMGAGNKMDASAFEVADIYETSICPLARVMRRELKKRGTKKLKVVYSKEPAIETKSEREHRPAQSASEGTAQSAAGQSEGALPQQRRQIPGSNAFVPAVAGLILASEVVRDLIGQEKSARGG